MESFSVFDIIGPRMTGPSSSHTAGAVRIAYIARRLIGEEISSVRFTLYGSFAETGRGHGTDKALIGGTSPRPGTTTKSSPPSASRHRTG